MSVRVSGHVGVVLACASILAGLLCTPAIAADTPAGDTSTQPAVPRSVLLEFVADNSRFTLIDARTPEEFDKSHIPGAVNLPHDKLAETDVALPDDADALIVIYCRTGRRARLLKTELEERGFRDVRVLESSQMHKFDDMIVFNCANPTAADSTGGPFSTAGGETEEEGK